MKDSQDISVTLPLNQENVELVLDELRPMLKADGGDVRLVGIDKTII